MIKKPTETNRRRFPYKKQRTIQPKLRTLTGHDKRVFKRLHKQALSLLEIRQNRYTLGELKNMTESVHQFLNRLLQKYSARTLLKRLRHGAGRVAILTAFLGVVSAAGATSTMAAGVGFELTSTAFFTAPAPADSAGGFADMDGDGDLDAVVTPPYGGGSAAIRYFRNDGGGTWTELTGATTPVNPFDGLALLLEGGTFYPNGASIVDYDLDGDLDLLANVTEGGGVKTQYFENTGTASAPAFTERTGVNNPFDGIFGGAVCGDFDQDGDTDCFIGGYIHLNVGGVLTSQVGTPYLPGPSDNHFISVVDVDQDGDLDIFRSDGTVLELQLNTGTPTNPSFTPKANTLPDHFANGAFSTVIDVDGDGLNDLIAPVSHLLKSDVRLFKGIALNDTTTVASFVNHTGTAANPFDTVIIGNNANHDYPSPALADMDNDGDLDAIIGNAYAFSYWKNTGTAQAPVFQDQTGTTGDIFAGMATWAASAGSFSKPGLADIDGDGDLDIFIGTDYGTQSGNGVIDFFLNTGTASAAVFGAAPEAAAANPFGATTISNRQTRLSFGDMDGDGDLDAIGGDSIGLISYFRNDAVVFTNLTDLGTGPLGGARGSSQSAPALIDMDGDGDLDIVFSDRSGEMTLLQNVGTATSPAFATVVVNNFLAGVNLGKYPHVAFGDLDDDGDLDMLVGFYEGNYTYDNLVDYWENTSPDIWAPVFTSGFPATSAIVDGGFDLSVNLNEAGTAYYAVVASGATAPTSAEVKAGTGFDAAGSITVTAKNTAYSANLTGLGTATDYDVYLVAEDGLGNLQATPSLLSVTTTDTTAPVFTTGFPNAANILETGFNLNVNMNEAGVIYYALVEAGTTAPTAAELKAGEGFILGGPITVTAKDMAYSVTLSGLSPVSDYDIYLVTEDGLGNLQATPSMLSVTTVDTTAPVFATGFPATANILETGFDLDVQMNEAGVVYYALVESETTAPTAAELKAGEGFILSGIITVDAADTSYSDTVTGLTAETVYDIYLVTEDGPGNLQATPTQLSATTAAAEIAVSNAAPSAPVLVGPADAADVDNPVTLSWNKSTDTDEDDLSYSVTVCEDADFAGCTETAVTAMLTPNQSGGILPWTLTLHAADGTVLQSTADVQKWLLVLMLLGGAAGLAGLTGNKRKKLVFTLIAIAVGLASCSDSGGGGDEAPVPVDEPTATTLEPTTPVVTVGEMTKVIDNLTSGTTYYWKVTADDGKGGITPSITRSFTVN